MKNLLIFLIGILALMSSGFGAEFYSVHQFSYEAAPASSTYVYGGECMNNDCSVLGANVEIYSGDAITCWNQHSEDLDAFEACMANYLVSNNIVSTNSVIIKQDSNVSFGNLLTFFASGDSYLPRYFQTINYACAFDVCFDDVPKSTHFEKKADAHAEIQQLNIKNLDNELKPVQVEVPVTIEETVCSAFRFTNPEMFRPVPPQGYSDYSANTEVTLTITNANTNAQYLTETVTIPIEADTCAGLAAFSWTPQAGLLDEEIKFRVDTDVIDNQVSSSIPDFAEVIETIYPENLNDSCWTRAYDFTLSNVPVFDLTTSIAQISEGETLYAGFRGAAYEDEVMTPINFRADFYFDNSLVHTTTLSSIPVLQDYFIDLSSSITGLPAGSHEVKLITTPLGNSCTNVADVEQIQHLEILTTPKHDVNFYVRDPQFNMLAGANVNLQLVAADDYYQNVPTYNLNQATNAAGFTQFNDAFSGNYTYTVSLSGYTSVSNEVHIASNTDIYVTLPEGNTAPVINLPDEITEYYQNTVQINLRDYVNDFNDLFSDLSLSEQITSGTGSANINNGILYVSTTTPNDVVVEVTVQDPSGDSTMDSITIHFVSNQAPIISLFEANPDNGDAPFTTNFAVAVQDSDGDSLSCTLMFGDGQQVQDTCSNLDNVQHIYTGVGTYNAILIAEDGTSEPVQEVEQIFVFERQYSSPHIDSFTLTSTNGNYIPTNLTLDWAVSHPDNLTMTCTLRVNGVSTPVSCTGSQNIDNFNILGTSRFTIIAIDSNGHQVLQIIDRNFVNQPGPTINWFYMTTSTGDYTLPNNLTFYYDVTHPDNLALTCTIDVNGNINIVPCSGPFNVNNYNLAGVGNFTLMGDDGSLTSSQTITQLFVSGNNSNNTVDLTLDLVDLILDDVVVPGDFKFGVSVMNETLNRRNLEFRPRVVCDGATISLSTQNDGAINSEAISKESRNEGFVYWFDMNTDEFTTTIPKDTNCRFILNVQDDYGTDIDVTKSVMFSYPEAEVLMQSIRGKGTDVLNYMSSALSSEISNGYNTISFRIENNELEEKEISITLSSTDLNLNINEEVFLGQGQEREVQIPVFVDEDVEKGLYPARISVYDGTDRQTRYIYINVD